MPATSVVISYIYLALPIAAVVVALVRTRVTRNSSSLRNLIVTSFAGAASGLGMMITYICTFHIDVAFGQIAIACYWGVAVATALYGFSTALAWAFQWMTPAGPDGRPCCMKAVIASAMLRAGILIAVIVPYVGAMVLIYRPRVVHPGTPATVLGSDYDDIAFAATDGTRIRGWWIPAAKWEPPELTGPGDAPVKAPRKWGKRTVIFCHGFGADKASQLRMIRDLTPHGYNVLAFDFRAHGESAGQLTSFGDLERRDVLGAVRWLRQTHAEESKSGIFGLGESLGAAALIAAAGDPGPDGQAIDAIAVFAPYDRLSTIVQDVADDHYVRNAGWLTTHIVLPIAGAQLGTPLAQFSPAREADKLAPRPLLIIACQKDREIDIARSQRFYEQASQPKYAWWIQRGGRRKMLFANENAATAVRVFFEMARQMI
jgi:predicted alpha/beta-fold hydrolase